MQSSIKHLLKHFALVLKAKLNQLKPFVRFVFQPSTLLHPPINQFIKGLHTQTFFILLYASFSCPYWAKPPNTSREHLTEEDGAAVETDVSQEKTRTAVTIVKVESPEPNVHRMAARRNKHCGEEKK